jgi:D-glycero-D-manno-heptose 1,7-bisphosphate phosphatase
MRSVNHKKIAFIDRDGVINKKAAAHEYITSPEEFVFNEGIFPLLRTLQEQGYYLIVITNQRGVARGSLSVETLGEIHAHMRHGLHERGIEILDVFFCPHEKDSCQCRKPKPGLLKQAFSKYTIDKSKSILISDSLEDVEMGQNFGLKQSILIPNDKPEQALEQLPKIRIAFVKFGGLASGGSEKMLQIIAANLNKDIFEVTYYYCNSAPYRGSPEYKHPNTDSDRVTYMNRRGVHLVEFHVGVKDTTTPTHIWRETDFWEKFREDDYDLIQTVRAGHKEYPFTHIRKTPIIEILGLQAGADNQTNIARSLHISRENVHAWLRAGGDESRVELVSLPIEMQGTGAESLREELGLSPDVFVYGMHQRADENIFSPIPLLAYKQIESDATAFVILGGGKRYQEQANALGLKNVRFLPSSGSSVVIERFLKTLNVFAHGRFDGEVNSQAMAEAMSFGLPIVSHTSIVNNGHIECVGNAGKVLSREDVIGYAKELNKLREEHSYYAERCVAAQHRFAEHYEISRQMKRFESLYHEVLRNPFPHPLRRFLYSLHWTQNIRILLKWVYLKGRHIINGRI